MPRLCAGVAGLLLALSALALALGPASLRDLVTDTGIRPATTATWKVHSRVQHAGAQILKSLLALAGLGLLTYVAGPLFRRFGSIVIVPVLKRALPARSVPHRALPGGCLAVALILMSGLPVSRESGLPKASAADQHWPNALVIGEALQLGPLRLSATFNSIGIELLFSGDANANAAATLSFKKATDLQWRLGLPLWRTADPSSPGPAFYGSAVLLDPGTLYDIRVRVDDPDGIVGSQVVRDQIMTRPEGIPPAAALQPTHYVRMTGDDANDGLSAARAWRSLLHAVRAAPPGALVQVGPGYYNLLPANPAPIRTAPLTFVAEFPAVDDGGKLIINEGRRSVVEHGIVSGPATALEPDVFWAPWAPVRLIGPNTGRVYKFWRWQTPEPGLTELAFAPTRAGLLTRIPYWKREGPSFATVVGSAEMIMENLTFNLGFFTDGVDLYARLPGDLDPNNLYVTAGFNPGIGSRRGLRFDGPSIRISGFEIRQVGAEFRSGATFGMVDHCFFQERGLYFIGSASGGVAPRYGSDHLVEHNYFRTTGLWPNDFQGALFAPWVWIKQKIKYKRDPISGALLPKDSPAGDIVQYVRRKLGSQAEDTAIRGRGGAHRLVVRYNTVDGFFNGMSPGYNLDYDRYAGMDNDYHDNLITRIADDAFEPDSAASTVGNINLRVWNNRVDRSLVFMSNAPSRYGPIYVFRNQAWRIGGPDPEGERGVSGRIFKYSGESEPTARVYVIHNTFWSDDPVSSGGTKSADGNVMSEAYYLRNNIFRMGRYAFSVHRIATGGWNEDYNHFATSDRRRGMSYDGRSYTTDVPAYRAASGQGAHTNVAGDFISPLVVDASFTNVTAGNLTLLSGSPFVDEGIPVPNVSDLSGVNYRGAAPDLGAIER